MTAIARVRLAPLPTPLERLEHVSGTLAGGELWIKRDDALGLAGGGNKVRKLEFLLGDALARRADVVLTSGALQSNHARLTAAACARAGLSCELWLNRRVPGRGPAYEQSGNMLLGRLLGADMHVVPGHIDAEAAALERARELRAAGRRPYVIPAGGSNPVGTAGYVACAHELLHQAEAIGVSFTAIVVAASSCGTLAGLSVGLGQAGWSGRLIGVAVSSPAPLLRPRVDRLIHDTAAELGFTGESLEPELDDHYIGSGYGIPTPEALEAVRRLARLEGVLLDPVYTGKAMAAVIDRLTRGSLDPGVVLFVHTGGWPALFGYVEDL